MDPRAELKFLGREKKKRIAVGRGEVIILEVTPKPCPY
jgi:hypothetical protein